MVIIRIPERAPRLVFDAGRWSGDDALAPLLDLLVDPLYAPGVTWDPAGEATARRCLALAGLEDAAEVVSVVPDVEDPADLPAGTVF